MKTATLADLPLLRRYLSASGRRLCVYSPGVLMMWRSYFRLALSEEEDTLTVRLAYDGREDSYLYPIGKDPLGAVERLAAKHRVSGTPLCFFGLEERDRDRLLSRFPSADVTEDRGEADYLYETAALATLRGKRFGGQRNHVNRFLRLYPDHAVEPITEDRVPALLSFLDEFATLHAERPLLAEELTMTREVLTHYGEYGMDGILLRIGERIAAFACGEVIGDTLSVHIEKADVRVAGAYQRIVSAFAARYDAETVPYLNREDDMGDEGLRTSKLSYHPVAILPKWRMRVEASSL